MVGGRVISNTTAIPIEMVELSGVTFTEVRDKTDAEGMNSTSTMRTFITEVLEVKFF